MCFDIQQVREAGEGGELWRGDGLDELVDGVAKGVEGEPGGGGPIGQVAFKGLPEPLDRIEFWAVGRQVDEGDVAGWLHGAGDMSRGVVEHQDIETVGVRLAELIQEQLKAGGIQGRQLPPKGGAGGRLHGGIQPGVLIQRRHDLDGFNAPRATHPGLRSISSPGDYSNAS